MNGFKGMGETLLFISGIGVALLISFISLVISLYKIFSKKENKKERAKKIAIKSIKRIFISVIIGFFAIIFMGFIYDQKLMIVRWKNRQIIVGFILLKFVGRVLMSVKIEYVYVFILQKIKFYWPNGYIYIQMLLSCRGDVTMSHMIQVMMKEV
ncbi:hypothetical protein [Collimonas silvisoli]|uniref:hypothetical protein n=1 Tax=Collimonas silvisoli TaxID=2825884 RepID=UPI001B8C914B|nr:hypothetical protein [Collimonas silvisoli]